MAAKAVIVGVANYQSKKIPDIPAVKKDVTRVRDLFNVCGIEVIQKLFNPGRTELFTSLRRHCKCAGQDDDLIIYFSGHGYGNRGRDYLVPSDAVIEDFEIIRDVLVAIDLDGALQETDAASITMIIDACREGIELTTKSLDFATWSFQKISEKTSCISIMYSCGHGDHSHVISDELGSLFTVSLCEAITARDYDEGTISNIASAAQKYVDANAKRYNKPKQTIVLNSTRRLDADVRRIFPDKPVLDRRDNPSRATPTTWSENFNRFVRLVRKLLHEKTTSIISTCWSARSTVSLSVLFALILPIIALTATDRELLLDEPLKLPIIDHPIDRPFLLFFTFGPIMFVLVHIFLMRQVLPLSHIAVAYNKIVDSDGDGELSRLRLTDATRERWLDWFLRAIAWITLALLPIGIILTFQFKFLPYHDHLATWMHRLLLVAELVIAFVLFLLVFDAGRVFSSKKVIWQAAWVAVPVAPCVMFSLLLAFPGEPHLDLLKNLLLKGNSPFCKTILNVNDRLEVMFLVHNEGTPNFRGRDLRCGKFAGSAFSKASLNNAKLEGADLKEANLEGAILTGAHLEGAILSEANLKHAQLVRAELKGAQLVGANFEGAILSEANFEGAILSEANLEGAILREANFEGAYLGETKLEGVTLAEMNLKSQLLFMAQLQGANLSRAKLRRADLSGAKLNDAILNGAELQEANLFEAQLRGAKLRDAKLQRAHLLGADLQRADLDGAHLGGADLSLAKLQGAHLRGAALISADLQRANLSGDAQLQGAKLWAAKLQGADLSGADLSGANLRGADLSEANLQRVILSNSELDLARIFDAQLSGAKGVDCSKAYVKNLKFETRQRARDCENSSKKVTETEYRLKHADLLRDIVCNATDDRKETADAIVRNWISDDQDRRDFSSRLASGLLGSDHKPCVPDMSDEALKRLGKFAPTTTPDK